MRAGTALALMALLATVPLRAEDDTDTALKLDSAIQSIDSAVSTKQKDAKTIQALIKTLSDDSQDVRLRERAAWALGALRAKSADTALITAAAHKSLLIRSAAINSLSQLRSKKALPLFSETAQRDPILSLRQRATIALGLLRSEKDIPVLVTLSSDPREEIRGAAALALGAVHSPKHSAAEILTEMKGDSSSYVQDRAIRALEGIQGKTELLRAQLDSNDPDVRLFAALHFGVRGKKSDLKFLKPLAGLDADEDVRQELNAAMSAIQKRAAAQAKKAATKKAATKPATQKPAQRQ